jgi:hypothetical protein
MMTSDPLRFQWKREGQHAGLPACSKHLRTLCAECAKKNGQRPRYARPRALIFAICGSSSGRFGLGAILEAVNLALDLGDAFLRFDNLTVDLSQFTQQFLSALVQAFHDGASCNSLNLTRHSWALLHALLARSKKNFSDHDE